MDPEFLEIVKLDLVAAFGRGCGSLTADPAAVKRVLASSEVLGLIGNHATDPNAWINSPHRFTVLHHACAIGQAAAHLAIMDESARLQIGESHINAAMIRLGSVWPSMQ